MKGLYMNRRISPAGNVAIAVSGLAFGFASGAWAQTGSLSIVPSAFTVDTTGASATFTFGVYGDADFGTAIDGGSFRLLGAVGIGVVTDMSVTPAPWASLGFFDHGYVQGANYNGVVYGQLIFPQGGLPPAPDSLLGNGPVLLSTFTVTLAADSVSTFDVSTAGGIEDYVLGIYDGQTKIVTPLDAEISFGSARVIIVPAPSTLAMIWLGGLAAGRRRR